MMSRQPVFDGAASLQTEQQQAEQQQAVMAQSGLEHSNGRSVLRTELGTYTYIKRRRGLLPLLLARSRSQQIGPLLILRHNQFC